MFNRMAVRITAIVAAVFVVLAVVLFIVGEVNEDPVDKNVSIASPDQLLVGLSYKTTVKCDMETVTEYVLSDLRFTDYSLTDDYCMVYQISTDLEEEKIIENLGISGELPDVDYRKNKLLLSVGREVERLSNKDKLASSGRRVLEIAYGEEYREGEVFVYTTRTVDFLTGIELEAYYLENISSQSNLIEGRRDGSELISSGNYHKIYLKKGGMYEYVIYAKDIGPVSRAFLTYRPEITEYNEEMMAVVTGDKMYYYNPVLNVSTKTSDYRLIHVKGKIIAFAREYNGEIIFVIRDVYNSANFSHTFRLPFSYDLANLNTLVKSVTVVDNTHVEVEYYSGSNKILKKEILKVDNMDYDK